jgi:LacI family transcriptional regulator
VVLKKRPTIKDVARESGLSLSTVSLVINDRGYVSDETRKKVLRVVERLSYHPTRSARGLASRTSGNVGFILSEDHFSAAEPFYTKIFLGTEFEARNHNYYILLTTVGPHFSRTAHIPRFLLERNVDGVIIAGKINEKLVDHIVGLGLPLILVDYELPRKRISAVLMDNRRGAHDAVCHLLRSGRQRVAFVGGDISHPSLALRYTAYRETLHEAGVPVDTGLIDVVEPKSGIDNGYAAMHRIFARDAHPSAVFAANDAMAIGCMRAIKDAGFDIPRDVAVVGFDDIDMSSLVEPRLSTVRVFKEEMGKVAIQRLVDLVKSDTQTVVTTHVPVALVVRESSAPPVAVSRGGLVA